MNEYINIFKAISDETRLKIISLISNRSICAKGIAKHLNITEAGVSQHIKVLKEANLLIGYKVGYHNIYDINEDTLNKVLFFIGSLKDNNSLNEKKSNNFIGCNRLNCFDKCAHKKCCHREILKEDFKMKVCFPVKCDEGMKSIPYGHFGTAPLFVMVDLESNEVRAIGNGDLGHEHGKCQPIKALSGETVDAVIVGGIGAGAITKLNSMGIKVYKAVEGNIEVNLDLFKKGELKEFPSTHTCSHDGCHH